MTENSLVSGSFFPSSEFSPKHLTRSYPEFGTSEEAGAVQDLLRAYDDGDDESARSTLSLPIFKYMDNAVS